MIGRTLVVGLALMGLCGCRQPAVVKAPEPVRLNIPEPKVTDGSLWQEDAGPQGMIADHTAHRKGDLLTINIVEDITAKRDNSLSTSRDQAVDAKIDQVVYPSWLKPTTGPNIGELPAVTGSSTRSYKGGGNLANTGSVRATLTAQVTQLLPNGNMIIMGQKEVIVAGDSQIVTLTGIVRPEDVAAGNIIYSNQIAEARINITGSGPLNDAQRRTLVGRVLDWINLF
jgi:flagellar L-ring protein precursor FlgH